MKNTIFTLVMLFSLNLSAQKYLDEIAKESCACAEKIEQPEGSEAYFMEFGLCMIDAANPYQKKIKKDFGLDILGNSDQSREFGELIGARMGGHCPNLILKLAANATEMLTAEEIQLETNDADEYEETIEMDFVEGKVEAIKNGEFLIYTINTGESNEEYFFITAFESDIELSDLKNMKDKSVMLNSIKMQVFDAANNEFKDVNVVKSIYLDE